MWSKVDESKSQQKSSPDAGQKDLTGQQQRTNSPVRKLLLFIFKSGLYWSEREREREREREQPTKYYHDFNPVILSMGCMSHQLDLFRDKINDLLSFFHVNCSEILNM